MAWPVNSLEILKRICQCQKVTGIKRVQKSIPIELFEPCMVGHHKVKNFSENYFKTSGIFDETSCRY